MMKDNHISKFAIRSAMALALAGLLSFPIGVHAGEKGATKLMPPSQAKPADQGISARHGPGVNCPPCKDSYQTVIEKTTKAVEPELRHHVARHGCASCTTVITSQGHGKQKTEKLAHVCRQAEAVGGGCCASKHDSGAK